MYTKQFFMGNGKLFGTFVKKYIEAKAEDNFKHVVIPKYTSDFRNVSMDMCIGRRPSLNKF